jgi:glycosyltransferase involved in cell wall biosynthesis
MSTQMKKILFITSSLNLGGAERQLFLLCNELRDYFEINILSLDGQGPLFSKYQNELDGFETIQSTQLGVLGVLLKLKKVIALHNPDVVVTWLYKADILGGIVTKLTSKTPVIWSARNSELPGFSKLKKLLLSSLSKTIPDYVVANGSPALSFHKTMGYPSRKLITIPNLVSPWTANVKSNSQLLQHVRPLTCVRIGIASRQVSGKGILETIASLSNLPKNFPQIELQIIGQTTSESIEWRRQGLYGKMKVREISSDEDLAQWFSNLDLYLMPSTSWESQPNSLIEAIVIGCPVLCSNKFTLDLDLPSNNLFDPLDAGSLISALSKIFDQSGSALNESASQLRLYLQKSNNSISTKKAWISLIEMAITKEKL